ncbi:hypothetical protein AGMMS49525_08720 [Bacteroidia bacterium]|nr:hypothetical protein AGMMS49525_08720 [Bacteroidia bacterium]
MKISYQNDYMTGYDSLKITAHHKITRITGQDVDPYKVRTQRTEAPDPKAPNSVSCGSTIKPLLALVTAV